MDGVRQCEWKQAGIKGRSASVLYEMEQCNANDLSPPM